MGATHRAIFALAAFLAAIPAATLSAAEMGRVDGRVVATPVAPVQRLGQPNEQPFKGGLTVLDENGATIAHVETGDSGAFHLALPPGRYSLRPEPVPKIGRISSGSEFVVRPGRTTKVRAVYDTGIR